MRSCGYWRQRPGARLGRGVEEQQRVSYIVTTLSPFLLRQLFPAETAEDWKK